MISFPEFPLLTSLGAGSLFVPSRLDINANDALTSISGFPLLTVLNARIQIVANDQLTNISGFGSLDGATITGDTIVNDNPKLDCSDPVPNIAPVTSSSGNATDSSTN